MDFCWVMPHRCAAACCVPGPPMLRAGPARLGVKLELVGSRVVVTLQAAAAQFLLLVRKEQALLCLPEDQSYPWTSWNNLP